MNKIDNIIDIIKTSLVYSMKACWMDGYSQGQSGDEAFEDGFDGDVIDLINYDLKPLEQLIPYIELGEIFVKEHFINTEYNTYELLLYKNEKERVTNLIQQIKEAEG